MTGLYRKLEIAELLDLAEERRHILKKYAVVVTTVIVKTCCKELDYAIIQRVNLIKRCRYLKLTN